LLPNKRLFKLHFVSLVFYILFDLLYSIFWHLGQFTDTVAIL